jgi:hypothetical protein
MNNHASLYILIAFFSGVLLLVLISYLRNKRGKDGGELAPKIPYTWDIPRYNDVEERFIKLKNVWFRLFCLVLVISSLIKGVELMNSQPLKAFPVAKEERMNINKSQVIKLSLADLDSLTKKQTILKAWLSEGTACKGVEENARRHILDNYKKSPIWITENKFELARVSKSTCNYVRGLARALLTQCSDSACISRTYNQITKYHQTWDSLDRPELKFNFDEFKLNERPQEAKEVFSYVGWYLDNKGKQ